MNRPDLCRICGVLGRHDDWCPVRFPMKGQSRKEALRTCDALIELGEWAEAVRYLKDWCESLVGPIRVRQEH